MHIETFSRFMGVRCLTLGHISDTKEGKLRRDRTKDVRRSAATAYKPLISND
jgi:hypothetical protein